MTSRVWRALHASTIAFALLALLPATADAQAKKEPTKINVLLANEATCTIYEPHLAKELGFFEKEGLDVNLLASETTVPYVAFLSNGDAEFVMLDSAQVLQAANAKQPIAVVYEAMQFAPEGIYVKADSDIKSVKDLKGKKVGLASDRDQITLVVALDSVGMSIDDVTTAVVGDSGPLLASSLKNGSIDAFAGSATDLAAIEANGLPVRDLTPPAVSENPGNSFAIWAPNKEKLGDIVPRFLRAWAMANHAALVDTKAAAAICKKTLPEQWENPTVGMNVLLAAAKQTNLVRTKQRGEPQPDVWARIQGPYVKLKEIDQKIEPKTFIDDSYIEAANDYSTADVKEAIAKWRKENADLMQ